MASYAFVLTSMGMGAGFVWVHRVQVVVAREMGQEWLVWLWTTFFGAAALGLMLLAGALLGARVTREEKLGSPGIEARKEEEPR